MYYKKPFIIFFIFLNFSLALFSETKTIEEILKDYTSEDITSETALEIMEALKDAGYLPGPKLDKLIEEQGFDSYKLRSLSPPPKKNDNKNNSETKYSALDLKFENSEFSLNSSAVVDGELLEEFKGEKKINGIEKSIPLNWSNVPEGTTSLAIIMYHYPKTNDKSNVNTYLLLWNINPSVTEILHGEADDGEWCMGSNKDGNRISYTSPNSPSAGVHIYQISIFALKNTLKTLPNKSSLEVNFDRFMTEIERNEIIGKADLIFKDINK